MSPHLTTAKGRFRSWGGLSCKPSAVIAAERLHGEALRNISWLAYGNGRSYGDSCFPGAQGTLVDTRGATRILAFNPDTGRIRVESGLTLGALIGALLGTGWFPAVVPGTQYVTIGGAIANDIHGKNHHGAGSFGCHVIALDLLRSDRGQLVCSRDENPDLFAATIGGLGLTGIILSAELQLMRVGSPDVIQDTQPLASLGDAFEPGVLDDPRFAYSVAWIDSLASGKALGRGVLLRANHADAGRGAPPSRPRLSVPFTPPVGVINTPSLAVFNRLYRWRSLAAAATGPIGWSSFFFPLDAVANWNRLYGPRGLRQHQSLIPRDGAETTIRTMLEVSQAAGHGSFLTVLKTFGDIPSPGVMSFARPGVTLTLDFPYRGAATDRLLDQLDALTLAAGGRVNIYKDARMSPATFWESYPEGKAFRAHMDPDARSAFSDRVGLTPLV